MTIDRKHQRHLAKTVAFVSQAFLAACRRPMLRRERAGHPEKATSSSTRD
ncbi:hypothetical protein AB0D57_36565 [Streptomyces sp. NPDC048275]